MSELAVVGHDRRDDIAVAVVVGEVDPSNVDSVTALLLDTPEPGDLGLVVDLARLEFVDSAGVAMLFDVAVRLRERGMRIALVLPPDAMVRRTLEITRLDDVSPFCPTVELAERVIRAS